MKNNKKPNSNNELGFLCYNLIMKDELRKQYLEIRKNIKDKELKSRIIMHKIISLKDYKKARIIALYNSLKNEVSTKELIEYSLNNNKIVVLPRVYKSTLRFYQISHEESYELSSFNIAEPEENISKLISKDKIDLIIVPGICFDLNGNRIGYGKGFYDRYLTDEMNTIGICFKEQITDTIPSDNHDKKMKKVITD